MTAKGALRRRIAWQLLGVCCLLLAVRYITLRHKPQRLEWRAEQGAPILHQGRAYWITEVGSPPASVIYSQRVTGGPVLQVVAEDPTLQINHFGPRGDLTFTKDSILYTVTRRVSTAGSGSGSSAVGAAVKYLGSFRPALQRPSPQEAAQEKRTTLRKSTGIADQTRLRRAPIAGGAPIDLGPIETGGLQPTEGYVYWFASRDNQTVEVIRGRTYWHEESGHSDLMATSLSNGSSHVVRAGLPAPGDLVETADGLVWMEPRPFPDRRNDLFYYRAADNRIYAVPDFRGSLTPNRWHDETIFELRGRLYWLASREIPDPYSPQPWQPDHLVSANLDASDLKTVLSWNKNKQMVSGIMFYRNTLYCLFDDLLLRYGYQPEPKQRPSLCRLHLDRADPIEVVYQLPQAAYDFQQDEDYLYFILPEEHRSVWGQLTNDNVVLATTKTLCRTTLPE